ncbi:MAG: prefoldin subunit alpha [Candidatus Heimdallarchaeota archaeon]|nr:MAG: prefoldin subunit alpha [Candidatus Heimdallarchaeota archaeon]
MSGSTIPNEAISRVRELQENIDQLQANIAAIEQQVNLIYRAMNSLNDAIKTQNELKTKKPGDEILIPIGGSNLILCMIKDPHKTYISLGSGITLHTELIDSEERNKSQIENLENSMKQLQEQHSQLSQKLNSERQELLKIAQKYQFF